jgi:hypothetical protein
VKVQGKLGVVTEPRRRLCRGRSDDEVETLRIDAGLAGY